MSYRFQFLCAAALLPAAIAVAPRAASAQDIAWGPGFLAFGNGCSSVAGDAQFITFGNDAAVLFSKFGVDLPGGGPDPALSDLKTCLVRIPATIRSGVMISTLTQKITYGVNKTGNTSGRIVSAASFFGLPVASYTVNVPFGMINSPTVTSPPLVTPFLVNTACNQVATGNYQANMAVGGSRASRAEGLILAMEGLDLRYDILLTIVPCP